jgi:catechol 2,3-dioxygenase-like lactoylglutathione lyase family enzyme
VQGQEIFKTGENMSITFQGPVIMVKDVELSRKFYEELLGQKVIADYGPVVGFEGGLSLWQVDHAYSLMFNTVFNDKTSLGRKNMELCFEESDIHAAWANISASNVALVHPLQEQPWGQLVFRIYDPDGHIIEVGEPIPVFVRRFLSQGMSIEEVSVRTSVPPEAVRQIADASNKT